MHTGALVRRFESAMRRVGEKVYIRINGKTYCKRGVVQNVGINFMRKYDDDHLTVAVTGRNKHRDKLLFLPYFKQWDESDSGVIRVVRHGKVYESLTDSVINVGDEPFYIWAILTEINTETGDYYGRLDD